MTDERYYAPSYAKSRRSPPVGESQSSGFFQTGQGGRTVLPPLSSAFPTSHFPVPNTYSNPYTQPRSSPGRTDYNPSSYGQWPNSASVPQASASFTYYDNHDPRYIMAQPFPGYPSSRTSPQIPSMPNDPRDSRKLAPIHVSTGRDDRWATSYPSNSHLDSSGYIRSPTASYPDSFAPYPGTTQANPFGYPSIPEARSHHNHHHHHSSMNQHQTSSLDAMIIPRTEHRRSPEEVSQPSYTPQSAASIQNEENIIKKKRKRADANQLKVLNEVYQRTAFPSTEERAELAKKLDMSARSVQIWFQNKRQSMRQTNRQSSTVSSSSHQPFSMSQSESMMDEMPLTGSGYNGSSMSMSGSSYAPRSSPDIARPTGHSSVSPFLQRRPRS